jgi:hypothetical protein
MSRPPRERKDRGPAPSSAGPSVGAIIAGIAGLAGAIGLGYLLGSASRDDDDEEKETQREVDQHRQQQQQRQQLISQRQAAHSYYPAQFSSSNTSASQAPSQAERKEGEPSQASAKPPQGQRAEGGIPSSHSASPLISSSDASSGVSISDPIPRSASAAPQSADVHHLTQQLDDATLCKVCYDSPLDCVLWPCRHQCCCFSCSRQLSECPICRSPFTSAEKVYRA